MFDMQEIFNASNRQGRRKILYTKDRRFTKKGFVFGLPGDSKLLKIAEHIYRRDHKNDRHKHRKEL